MLSAIDTERVCRVLARLAVQIQEIEENEASESFSTRGEEDTRNGFDVYRIAVERKRRRVRSAILADAS